MSVKRKYTEDFTVRLTPDMAERLVAVADHPRVQEANAAVIRDLVEMALPQVERSLGIIPEAEIAVQEVGWDVAQGGWGPDGGAR